MLTRWFCAVLPCGWTHAHSNLTSMPPPPLLGYNNNVRHRGRIFHIQTEDSGLQNPRIMTHLFADGGRIVKSRRTDYSEHIGRDDQVEVVRGLMKEQHKAMFVALRCGEFDALIGFDAEAPPPSLSSRGVRQQAEELTPASKQQEGAPSGAALPSAALHTASLPSVSATPRPEAQGKEPSAPPGAVPGVTQVAPPPPAASADPLAPAPGATTRRASRRPPKPSEPAQAEPARSEGGRPYAAPRPASIFAEAPQAGESLFGESAMDEKSLDSAILSYLSEDEDEE